MRLNSIRMVCSLFLSEFPFKEDPIYGLWCYHTTMLQGFSFNKGIIQANYLNHRTAEQNQRLLACGNVLGRSGRLPTKQYKTGLRDKPCSTWTLVHLNSLINRTCMSQKSNTQVIFGLIWDISLTFLRE